MEAKEISSVKDLRTSQTSLVSGKSLDKSSNSGSLKQSQEASTKSEKIHFKDDQQDQDCGGDNQQQHHHKLNPDASLKVPNKIIANWRHACDRTKDKTKDLLKRWRTLPEIETPGGVEAGKKTDGTIDDQNEHNCGWSVHVWTTWVDRFSIDSDADNKPEIQLTVTQSTKFSHFFTCLLDHDHDNLISEQDFETLIERLRHFADWSVNSSEFNILREVERGFIETFLCSDVDDEKLGFTLNGEVYLTKEGWLLKWAQLTDGSRNLCDFPIWLQFFGKVLFQVINRCGSGVITRDELSSFYSSVLGLDAVKVGQLIDVAYQAMTSNGDHPLMFKAYRLCFANYLLGRYQNGPGQYILGAPPNSFPSAMFPVDYSALNTQPEDLEQYAPNQKTNRRSVIV